MSKYTPGPWAVGHRHGQCTIYDDEQSGLGLEVIGPPEPMLRGQFSKSADARLIAAAPDLLEACKALTEALAFNPIGKGAKEKRQYMIDEAYEAGIAAIVKATGGEV